MNRKNQALMVTVACVALLLLSCGPATLLTPTPASTSTFTPTPTEGEPLLITLTPTPTPVGVFRSTTATPTVTASPPPPSRGELDLRFLDALTLEECESHFPFIITWGSDRNTIEGDGTIDCIFETSDFHVEYYFPGHLEGEILPGTSDYPNGSLSASLSGTFKQTIITTGPYDPDFPPPMHPGYPMCCGGNLYHAFVFRVRGRRDVRVY